MKKKIIRRCLAGMPVGVMISVVITIIISLTNGDGKYYMVHPDLVTDCGTEIAAVIIQTLCSMLYGAAFAGASVVWDTDWSLTKMTAVHFLICSAATFPIAYLIRWMNHTPAGILRYFGIFLAVYVAIWIVAYMKTKRNINAINQKVKDLT